MKKSISSLLCIVVVIFGITPLTTTASTLSNKENSEIYKGVLSYVNEVYVDLNSNDKKLLVDELYNEKIQSIKDSMKSTLITLKSPTNEINEVDLAFERIQKEEEYIVNLINSQGESTTLDKWKFNLNYLEENYDSLIKIPDVNSFYIDSYIEAYRIVLSNENMPDEKVATGITTYGLIGDPYDRNAALQYAKTYYSNYNPNYPDWSYWGDCANFVSQCLRAGGKGMKGTPGTQSSADYFGNWFSVGTTTSTVNVSSTWRGADAFMSYWKSNATSYKTFTSVSSSSWNYGFIGDAVSFLNSNNRAGHTMIITGYNNPDFQLAGHTSDVLYGSLQSKASGYSSFVIYNMK